jgi:hypothetical protein
VHKDCPEIRHLNETQEPTTHSVGLLFESSLTLLHLADGVFEITAFFIGPTFQPHYGAGVDSASNRNENQESSWG